MVKKDRKVDFRIANMGLICSILVVLIHTGAMPSKGSPLWWIYSILGQGMATIAVPYFFLVSGYMLGMHCWNDGAWWFAAVRKRVPTLLVPYVLWNLLYIAWMWLLCFCAEEIGYSIHVPGAMPMSAGEWFALIGLNPMTQSAHEHLWYIRSLYIFVLISPVLMRVSDSVLKVVIVYFILGCARMLLWERGCWAWFFDRTIPLQGLGFFMLGMCLRKDSIRPLVNWKHGIALLVSGASVFLFDAMYEYAECPHFELAHTWFRWLGVPMFLYGLWVFVPQRQIFGTLVKFSFPLYVVHGFVALVIAGLIGCMGLRDLAMTSSVPMYFGRWFVCVVVTLIVVKVLKVGLHMFYRIAFGGRG